MTSNNVLFYVAYDSLLLHVGAIPIRSGLSWLTSDISKARLSQFNCNCNCLLELSLAMAINIIQLH